MFLRWSASLLPRTATSLMQPSRTLYNRGESIMVSSSRKAEMTSITSALSTHHHAVKVVFNNDIVADFKYIWLRDNCQCSKCLDVNTKQKVVDSLVLDVNVRPESLLINSKGQLEIEWSEESGSHKSEYDPHWLLKYGQSFLRNSFGSDSMDVDTMPLRSEIELWDRNTIWSNFPEVSYAEMMESDSGLRQWLDIFYKCGVVFLRGVPTQEKKITEVVERFAFVKETLYGRTFDVINKTTKGAHLAFSGLALAHHTDMNYIEKSPGMQLLHCLKANDPTLSSGRSFFADGFRIAKWLEENEPAAFLVLISIPIRFWVRNEGQQYSALWPIVCTNSGGDVIEVHYNNRTMKPLQAPTHVVRPFYHAYKLFSDKLRDPSSSLEFSMKPGDLVAFNNRRVLHGRTAFDPTKTERHLVSCYADMDETLSKYDSLQAKFHSQKIMRCDTCQDSGSNLD